MRDAKSTRTRAGARPPGASGGSSPTSRRARVRRYLRRLSRRNAGRPPLHRAGDRARRRVGAVGDTRISHGTPTGACRTSACRNCAQRAGDIASRVYGEPSAICGWSASRAPTARRPAAMDRAGARRVRPAHRRCIGTLGYGLCRRTLQPLANHHARRGVAARASSRAICAAARARRRWKCRRIGLDQGRVAGVDSTSRSSPISRATISTTTAPWSVRRAKARLFDARRLKRAVLNVDDAFGRELADARWPRAADRTESAARPANARRRTASRASCSELRDAHGHSHSSRRWGAGDVASPLLGDFNVENLLAVLGVAARLSECRSSERWRRSRALQPPPGRMERLGGGTSPLVVVDYAHTPDALEKVLAGARGRAHARGRG